MTQEPVPPQSPNPQEPSALPVPQEPSALPVPQPPPPAGFPPPAPPVAPIPTAGLYPPVGAPQSAPPGYPYPQSAPPYPQSVPPYPQSAPPYPQSAPPYPQSAPPGYAWPVDANGQPLPVPMAPPPAPANPGKRKVAIIASAVGAVVIAAAVTAVVVVKANAEPEPTGQDAVAAYLDKLVAGDIEGALTFVDPASKEEIEDEPMLDPEFLADPGNRPKGFEVVSRVQRSETRETITVTYTIGDTKITEEYDARRPAPDQPWVIEAPFHRIEIYVDSEREVRVNGVLIRPGRAETFLAFPGLYTATLDGDELFKDLSVEGEITGGDFSLVYHEIDLTNAGLKPDAEEKVQAAVNTLLDGCAQDHGKVPMMTNGDGAPVRCPFYLTNTESFSVNWSIGSYPDVSVTPAGDNVYVSAAKPGLVKYDVPYPWIDGSFEFPFAATAYDEGGVVKVTFFG